MPNSLQTTRQNNSAKSSTMPFPIHRRPGGVLFLDDDPDYLEMLAQVMPRQWFVRLLLRPIECIEVLHEEMPVREADAWRQQEIINRWHSGALLIAEILKYWREDAGARFALTQVCVVDYAMPAMSGLQVLSELSNWSGSRVLLTGRVEEQLAVSAFNRGLIERFVPKQAPDIRARLTTVIQDLLDLPDSRHEQIWRATLSREQYDLVSDPSVSQALADFSKQESWAEHILIGAPFGVLAVDKDGSVIWLQLEAESKLNELAEMAESQGWDSVTADDIRAGRKMVDLELQLPLGAVHKPRALPAFSIGNSALLRGSLFKLDEFVQKDSILSYSRFIDNRGDRILQD
jgi:CheY-like chemotaxis protein